MPCNSAYLEPNKEEENRQRLAKLLIFVDQKTKKPTPKTIIKIAESIYGEGKLSTDTLVQRLCKKLTEMKEIKREKIVYDARNATSRDLADWWEEHQKADQKRIKKEAEIAEKKKVRDEALKKLSAKERAALKV